MLFPDLNRLKLFQSYRLLTRINRRDNCLQKDLPPCLGTFGSALKLRLVSQSGDLQNPRFEKLGGKTLVLPSDKWLNRVIK
jgi:hypothetical protein